jgi:hypothetical protein
MNELEVEKTALVMQNLMEEEVTVVGVYLLSSVLEVALNTSNFQSEKK